MVKIAKKAGTGLLFAVNNSAAQRNGHETVAEAVFCLLAMFGGIEPENAENAE